MTEPKIRSMPSHTGNVGASRPPASIRYIVIHYTGNDGDSAASNGAYFGRTKLETSAHYFVDSREIVQSVDDSRIAWHCGAKIYRHPEARNANSIGVELCDDNRDGVIRPSQATIDRALELTRWLMQKYGVPADRVIRHYDVSGKLCPAYWCGSRDADALWRSAFHDKLYRAQAEKGKEVTPVTTEGKRYQTIEEIERNAPWAFMTVKGLMDSGAILGDGTGLDLSRDMLRLLVINDRSGAYDK